MDINGIVLVSYVLLFHCKLIYIVEIKIWNVVLVTKEFLGTIWILHDYINYDCSNSPLHFTLNVLKESLNQE